MKIRIVTYMVVFLLCPLFAVGQIHVTNTDSVPSQIKPGKLGAARDTLNSDTAHVTFKVRPWSYHAPIGAMVDATDSTLRWQIWPSWTFKKNREPGVISFRLGELGRTNAQQIDAQEPKYQQLYWEDIRLNDPVSGTVNWNIISHHKIKKLYENDEGVVHNTRYYLREYYVNKPLTQLNYDEAKYNYRNLEFVVSQNLTQKTNAEISYWDRMDGGAYNNSEVKGHQIYARISHQLNQRQELKLNFLNDQYSNDLPFGYAIFDPETFNFDRFTTTALEPQADADRASTILGLGYYRRPADSSKTTSNFHAGVYMHSTKRGVTYSADTTSYKVQELGSYLHKWNQFGPLRTEANLSYHYFINKEQARSNLQTDNWGLLQGDLHVLLQPVPFFKLRGTGHYRLRSDDFKDYSLGTEAELSVLSRVDLSAGLATGSRMPTPQQLYWQSANFRGDPNLKMEQIHELHAALQVHPFTGSTIGARTQLKQIENGIMVNSDSTFANANGYSSLSAAAFLNYQSTHFEVSGSATMQHFGNFLKDRLQPLPVDETQRVWFKASAYVKGYLFDRATYVKGGLSGVMAPQAYQAAHYYPALDYWQSTRDDPFIPSFNRIDVDFSARLRSIFFVLRYENALDGLMQQGYFETAGYPMPARRFIFGIRVLFRN